MDKLNLMVGRLKEELGLSDQEVVFESNIYKISVGPDHELLLSSISEAYIIQISIAPYPKTNDEMLSTEILHANLLGQGTGGAILGLSANEEMLILIQEIPDTYDYQNFRVLLENFLNIADFWRSKVNEFTNSRKPSQLINH